MLIACTWCFLQIGFLLLAWVNLPANPTAYIFTSQDDDNDEEFDEEEDDEEEVR
jgi:hypothetical protein